MKALAIHYGHNCTVGLTVNGRLVSLLSEERICRTKNATGFPFRALQACADRYLDGNPGNADRIAIIDGTGHGAAYLLRHGLTPHRYLDYYWKKKTVLWKQLTMPGYSGAKNAIRTLLSPFRRAAEDMREQILHSIGIDRNKVSYHDHHACHAASAAYFRPVADGNTWLVLTLDAEGDGLSSSVSIFRDGSFERIASNSSKVSLGYLYAETTAYLGMKPNEHEFKLMGMAPYADPEQVQRLAAELAKIIRLNEEGIFVSSVAANSLLPHLVRLYAFERFDVICGALQKVTEDLICSWAGYWVQKTGVSRVAVSGGVFMNVKAAKKLAEQQFVDQIFVVPSSSDESLPIGALWFVNQESGVEPEPIGNLYLGCEFDDEYVNGMIHRDGLDMFYDIERFDSHEDAGARVATLLASDEIVARCCGREEWGARALGNRSILCNPSKFENIERLNNKIKCRDFWMPFTPSLLEEEITRYVVNPKEIFAPYMAITFETTPLARRHFAAAVHPRDFTMRPQAVLQDWNPAYHSLIRQFHDITGIGGILNTSFNLHGEPNVSTPEDAIRTVRASGLDYVLIENTLFRKKSK